MVSLERQCWSNSQYSRCDCLEISEFLESLKNEDLEETVLKVFEELNVVVYLSNVEDCHWVASRTSNKVIIKLSRRKDANKICRVKKNLKNLNVSSLTIKNPVFINDSFCSYYKMLWSKCKKLSSTRSIHAFWVSNGFIRLRIGENDRVNNITHLSDLEELFPGNNFFQTTARVLYMLIFFTFIYPLVCWVTYLFVGFEVVFFLFFFLVSFLHFLSPFCFFADVIQQSPSICFLCSDPSIHSYYNLC